VEFTPKQYLLLYALIVTPLVISFFFLRRRQTPTKLNFNAGQKANDAQDAIDGTTKPGRPAPLAAPLAANLVRQLPQPPRQNETRNPPRYSAGTVTEIRPRSKSLNVFFQWNSHAWDAYEVLGIPAGSSPESAALAYQEQIRKGDPDSMLFFKAAYEAILHANLSK
jgi:hypothetical protein